MLFFLAVVILFTLPQSSPIANKALEIAFAYRAHSKYACLSDNECPLGQYCNFADGGLREFGECVLLVKEKGKCFSSNDCDTWVWLDESEGPFEHHNCQAGLFCDGMGNVGKVSSAVIHRR